VAYDDLVRELDDVIPRLGALGAPLLLDVVVEPTRTFEP
jgi:hypothetical protein